MDLNKVLETAKTQSGLDPEVEKKATQYAQQAWTMDVYPVLKAVYGDELNTDTISAFQEALFDHKYTVVEAASDKKAATKEAGLRFSV